jgi:hypothetical protein
MPILDILIMLSSIWPDVLTAEELDSILNP